MRRTILIAAPIEKVWAAVTEPEQISHWFGATSFDGAVGGASASVGALGTITWPERDAVPVRIEAIDAPRLVSCRWCNPCLGEPVPTEIDEAHSTVFTFTLEPLPDGTRLTVVETGFETTSDPSADLERHRGGWDGEGDASASALAGLLPVSRQAIAKHLAVLQEVGLVEPVRVGREVRYRVVGASLDATARRLEALGVEWDRRLAAIKQVAEGL
ncbi:SRPBCC domain-containing protein [Herbiconiux ginsengi]|uniref:SRPBCC domain-containing protein n=1 Tax=Herbiconiux ginsengi TaxID=381665 RepID=UPI000B2ABC7F|nr:SRPBCC domain-containing protein [Herbiconiux ginsengi]